MPFTVQDLLVDKVKPVSVAKTAKAQDALRLMIEGDYSQLPVIDENERVDGIVTSDSIVRTLNSLNLKLSDLTVSHCCNTKAATVAASDDIFDVLQKLRDSYAVVVVDAKGRLEGIITNFDTANYFRNRAEDMMMVEDIEGVIKDCLRVDLIAQQGQLDDDQLMVSIGDGDAKKQKDERMSIILEAFNIADSSPKNNQMKSIADMVENRIANQPPKAFCDLSLGHYISLLIDKSRWDRYGHILGYPSQTFTELLERIRIIRNDLFHFRTELAADRREQLRYCREELNKHQAAIMDALRPQGVKDSGAVTIEQIANEGTDIPKTIRQKIAEAIQEEPQLMDDDLNGEPGHSEIGTFFNTLPRHIENVVFTFEEFAEISVRELPHAAYEHRSWWSNDTLGHLRATQWLDAGWRVASVNISQQMVTFARIRDREQRYISFFSELLSKIKISQFDLRDVSPTGRSFLRLNELRTSENDRIGFIGCSFARRNRFRIEFYLDTRDHQKNQFIFNGLLELRSEVEDKFARKLEWENLEDRRAFRVATYLPGAITDEADDLDKLSTNAANLARDFDQVFLHDMSRLICDLANKAENLNG